MFRYGIVRRITGSSASVFSKTVRFASTALYTWGNSESGCLGHAKFDDITRDPRRLVNSKRFAQVSCGEKYTLAVDHQGALFGWGTGPHSMDSKVPVPIPLPGGVEVVKAIAGKRHAGCIDRNGNLYTWGKQKGGWFSGGGQLGHGEKLTSISEPTLLKSLQEYGAKVKDIACGAQHTLILTDDGEILSCGVGEYCRLGTGSSSDIYIPASLDSLDGTHVVQIAAGHNHSMCLSKDGAVYTWGRNDGGQLGFADTYIDIYSMEEYPRRIDQSAFGNKKVVQIAASNCRSAAVTEDGKLYVWGRKQNHYPTVVDSSEEFSSDCVVKKVVLGLDESDRHCGLVLTDDGACWSYGSYKTNMLGMSKESRGNTHIPERIESLKTKTVRDIVAGVGHCAAIIDMETA